LCGSCLKAWPANALVHESGLFQGDEFLLNHKKTVAVLDPSCPAILDVETPHQLATALNKIGFTEIWEGTCGVKWVAKAYWQLLEKEGR